jgi:hypothetical protein
MELEEGEFTREEAFTLCRDYQANLLDLLDHHRETYGNDAPD